MSDPTVIINQTRKWIQDVVVGCNFCPFASMELKQNRIHYQVETSSDLTTCINAFQQECERLDKEEGIDTTLLIFSHAFHQFNYFLRIVSMAEKSIKRNGYEGIYQVASFHPLYRFSNSAVNDPANYTNRSIYPMLHLLREKQIEEVLLGYPHPELIPKNNMSFARQKGEAYMKMLRQSCI